MKLRFAMNYGTTQNNLAYIAVHSRKHNANYTIFGPTARNLRCHSRYLINSGMYPLLPFRVVYVQYSMPFVQKSVDNGSVGS